MPATQEQLPAIAMDGMYGGNEEQLPALFADVQLSTY